MCGLLPSTVVFSNNANMVCLFMHTAVPVKVCVPSCVKPLVNFNITYQAGQYDNINQLSGGEGDRVSLALTLALNRLSSSKLLLLDESFASLDGGLKESALKCIRHLSDSTVLVIMHDGVEGLYDNVINLDH